MKAHIFVLIAICCQPLWSPSAGADSARNYISIVGSTVMQPLAIAVSEQIAKSHKIKPPMIESNGTGGGLTLFCEGVGLAYPDIANAVRPMLPKELAACRSNGVSDILEIKVGSGAVVFVQSPQATPFDLTRKSLFLALAKRIPDPSCKTPCEKLIANPYHTWRQVDPALPDLPIEILGPPASSGTSDGFMTVVMDAVCDTYPWLAAKKDHHEDEYRRICHALREDGVYIEETGSRILSRISGGSKAIGIVTYAAVHESKIPVRKLALEGIQADEAQVASGIYPLSKPLVMYVKKDHVDRVPGLGRYLAEFTSDKAWGRKGYLAAMGLVPMGSSERAGYAGIARDLTPMREGAKSLSIPISVAEESVAEASNAKAAKGNKKRLQK